MCNLSQGIEEKGIAKGRAEGIAQGEARIIVNMHHNGFTMEQIAQATNKDLEEIEAIIRRSISSDEAAQADGKSF